MTTPPPQPDAHLYPSETELNHALAQAQQVLSACMAQAVGTGNPQLHRRCEQLVIDSAACWNIVVNNLVDDGQVACFLMDAAELASELAATYRYHGAETEAISTARVARGLAQLSLQLDPDFWLADPHAFD
ncbi:hypothetical protein [Deinococcus marmoris]|uniref:hypothetical protein n=1 Tax=Deinococcus marmoris TaxID=249408 RepID=UPI000AD00F91|nr:hypothetical protein [Deinococcus marmoris]